MNQGISKSRGKYIFQLNPDTELVEDSISKMHNYISNNDSPIILGPKITSESGKIQQSYCFFLKYFRNTGNRKRNLLKFFYF